MREDEIEYFDRRLAAMKTPGEVGDQTWSTVPAGFERLRAGPDGDADVAPGRAIHGHGKACVAVHRGDLRLDLAMNGCDTFPGPWNVGARGDNPNEHDLTAS
jgi:hypothetical protein